MDVRLWVTRKVYKHVGRARIRELQEWFCNLVPSVLIVNQLVEMPRHRYVLSMPQMLQLCTVYAQSTTDTAALYCCSSVLSMCSPTQILQLCLCAAHHSYCSSVLSMPQILSPVLSMHRPQILQLCTVYATDTAALYCLCAAHHIYCNSVLSIPQILQLCTVYATDTAALYCCRSVLCAAHHRDCSSVLSMRRQSKWAVSTRREGRPEVVCRL